MKGLARQLKPKRIALSLFLATLTASFLGCSPRGITNTTINTNGSWARQVTFKQIKTEGAKEEPKIEDCFILPDGNEWKRVKVTPEKNETVIAFHRTMKLGESSQGDVTMLDVKKKVVCSNSVSVKQIAPGRFEYSETFHWKGAMPKDLGEIASKQLAELKKCLPSKLSSDANAKDIAFSMSKEFYVVMFGPTDPFINHLVQFVTAPEALERQLRKKLAAVFLKVLAEKFGSQLTLEERKEIVVKMIHSQVNQMNDKTQEKTSGKTEEGSNSPVSMFSSVKIPGKIIETNGEFDEFSGEVYWSFYPEAAAAGDFTLKVVCESK